MIMTKCIYARRLTAALKKNNRIKKRITDKNTSVRRKATYTEVIFMKFKIKHWETAIAHGLALTFLLSMLSFSAQCGSIRHDVLRLHILANSDSESDQALKLKVRDELLKESGDIFSGDTGIEQAMDSARQNLSKMTEIAQNAVNKQGYDYHVTVKLEKTYFETRHYDKYTLPAGEYNAVRVLIGSGEGHNWWCVMYPSLCVPAASDNYDDALDENEQDVVENYPKYEIKFKIVEVFQWLKNQL